MLNITSFKRVNKQSASENFAKGLYTFNGTCAQWLDYNMLYQKKCLGAHLISACNGFCSFQGCQMKEGTGLDFDCLRI